MSKNVSFLSPFSPLQIGEGAGVRLLKTDNWKLIHHFHRLIAGLNDIYAVRCDVQGFRVAGGDALINQVAGDAVHAPGLAGG